MCRVTEFVESYTAQLDRHSVSFRSRHITLFIMEVDEHYERFDMDNDFEGGKWVGDEFFYTNKKRKRQQTKDEQLYGYDSDLSDSERPRRGRGEKKQTDYSQPVGFVSSGVVRSTDEKPEDVEQAEHSAGGLGLGSKARPSQNGGGLGLGAAGVGAADGLGFKAALDPNAMGLDDDEDDNVVMPTSFGKRCSPLQVFWHAILFLADLAWMISPPLLP